MTKYLLLKHYRGAPAAVNDVPMDQWEPDEVEAHIQFMNDFAARLERTGEFVDGQALSPEGVWVRFDGEGRPPVTDGPFAETKDLIAGVGGRPTFGSQGLADHRLLESVPRHGAIGHRPPRPRGPIRQGPANRSGTERRQHPAPLLPMRAPRPDAVIGGCPHAPGGGRPHYAPDRTGLPRAREHHGAADQPGQAHGRAEPVSIVLARCEP